MLNRVAVRRTCFHFAGSGENLPDIAKSRDASIDNKDLASLLQIEEAEQLPVNLSHKLPFFQLRSSYKLHKGLHVI